MATTTLTAEQARTEALKCALVILRTATVDGDHAIPRITVAGWAEHNGFTGAAQRLFTAAFDGVCDALWDEVRHRMAASEPSTVTITTQDAPGQ